MRIAVTYQDGQVFPHFGHTEQFKIYEVENNQVIRSMVIPSTGFGHGALADFLKQAGVQLVICGGIGGGAIAALNAAGILLKAGVGGEADLAVQHFLEGKLPDVVPVCSHHAEGHSCGNHGEDGSCGHHGTDGSCGEHCH